MGKNGGWTLMDADKRKKLRRDQAYPCPSASIRGSDFRFLNLTHKAAGGLDAELVAPGQVPELHLCAECLTERPGGEDSVARA